MFASVRTYNDAKNAKKIARRRSGRSTDEVSHAKSGSMLPRFSRLRARTSPSDAVMLSLNGTATPR